MAAHTGAAHHHRRCQAIGGPAQPVASELRDSATFRVLPQCLQRVSLETVERLGAALGKGIVRQKLVGDASVAVGMVKQRAQLNRQGGRDGNAAMDISVVFAIHRLAVGRLQPGDHIVCVVRANSISQGGNFVGLKLHLRHRGARDGPHHHDW